MLDRFLYFVSTFAEAGLAVFGINSIYEQPAYTVRADLGDGLEIRDYRPATAVETTVTAPNRDLASNRAFRLLFAYIAGENSGGQTIAMTTPVQREPVLIPMTAPVRTDVADKPGETSLTMRFFLPSKRAASPPVPLDPQVRLTTVPGATVAALRFSGNAPEPVRAAKEADLLTRLARTAWQPAGTPYLLGYDPPFTITFLKRNEVAVAVSPRAVQRSIHDAHGEDRTDAAKGNAVASICDIANAIEDRVPDPDPAPPSLAPVPASSTFARSSSASMWCPPGQRITTSFSQPVYTSIWAIIQGKSIATSQ